MKSLTVWLVGLVGRELQGWLVGFSRDIYIYIWVFPKIGVGPPNHPF